MIFPERARAAIRPLALVFAALLAPAPVLAQQPLTRADSADVLVGAAERLDAEGADELAEALARLVERRFADTPAAARAALLRAAMLGTRRDRSGRVELIAGSTVYGAWLGIAIPLMLGSEEPEIYGLGLILGAPSGFMAGRSYTRDRSVSAGDARAITLGATWGTWQGFGWAQVLELGQGAPCPPDELCGGDDGLEETIGAMVAGGLLGITAGAIAANNADIGAGTATLVNFGALWGTWYGVVAAVLSDFDNRDDGLLTAALIGGDIGLGAMIVVAPRLDMSRNRARLINAAGIIGLAVGGGVDLLITPENEKVAIAIPAIGSVAGLWLGTHVTRDYDDAPALRQGYLGDDTGSPALARLRDGAWSAGVPRPSPVLLGAGGPGARRAALGVRVPILDARF